MNQSLPWLVIGDFNEIVFSFEKKGASQVREKHVFVSFDIR